MSSAGPENLGNRTDYAFGCAEGWKPFEVVRFHAVEEVSRLYAFEIVLLRRVENGAADLDTLLDANVSLRIASAARWRVVHGIIAEAEEIDRTSTIFLYRVLLVPQLERARHRRRCRNFVGMTLEDILVAVLENRSPAHPSGNGGLARLAGDLSRPPAQPDFTSFTPATAKYRLAITEASRITAAENSPYIVQYNESDFAFLARLCEKEGIAFYFEQAADATVLTLTDKPGQDPLFSTDATFDLRSVARGGQASREQEVVRSLRDARRLRSTAVTVREYDWHRSRTLFDRTEPGGGDPDTLGAFQFAAEDENQAADPAGFPAKIRLERLQVERAMRDGTSTVRTLEPGYRTRVRDADGLREDADLLVVRVETFAATLFPEGTVLDDEHFGFGRARDAKTPMHENRLRALPTDVPFRPAQATQKPRIAGIQTATVTAEEFSGSPPEINADANGCVRLRFPWDQRADTGDQTPTSSWIRVSQYWAGAGYGALYTPRVGHEVLVAYLQGDPDRPVIVGRVHNPQNPPPYDASQEPTKSTVKSQSSPHATGSNELRFEDKAGKEEIYLHAQQDLDEVVNADHSTAVGHDQSNTVQNDQTNTVHANRTHRVDSDESTSVGNDQTNGVGNDQTNQVGNDQVTSVGNDQTLAVGADQTISVGGQQTVSVGGDRKLGVDGDEKIFVGVSRSISVGAHQSVSIGAGQTIDVTGGQTETITGASTASATGGFVFTGPTCTTNCSAVCTVSSPVTLMSQTAMWTMTAGSATVVAAPGMLVLTSGGGATVALIGGLVMIKGSVVSISADGNATLHAGGTLNETSPTINLN
ncbi:MAG TPA: type VI secretion system tip protein TssI/VgrG [Byssovorax sp.]|jgi:type VI secretion system secreted protein VgrG